MSDLIRLTLSGTYTRIQEPYGKIIKKRAREDPRDTGGYFRIDPVPHAFGGVQGSILASSTVMAWRGCIEIARGVSTLLTAEFCAGESGCSGVRASGSPISLAAGPGLLILSPVGLGLLW